MYLVWLYIRSTFEYVYLKLQHSWSVCVNIRLLLVTFGKHQSKMESSVTFPSLTVYTRLMYFLNSGHLGTSPHTTVTDTSTERQATCNERISTWGACARPAPTHNPRLPRGEDLLINCRNNSTARTATPKWMVLEIGILFPGWGGTLCLFHSGTKPFFVTVSSGKIQ